MKPKHTPGPWIVNIVEGKDHFSQCLISNSVGDVAIDCMGSGKNKKQDIANAHLIAAAPELLEALEHAADVISAWSDWAEDRQTDAENCEISKMKSMLRAELQMVRTTIAKARGEK